MPLGKVKPVSCVICEQVRHEIGGSKSIIGMNGGSYEIYKANVSIPVSFVAEFEIVGLGDLSLQYRLKWLTGQGEVQFYDEVYSGVTGELGKFILSMFDADILVKVPGELSLQYRQNNGRWTQLRKLHIQLSKSKKD